MKRRALLLLLAASGCQRSRPAAPLARALLEVAVRAGEATPAEVDASLAELSHLAELAQAALVAAAAKPASSVLGELLFQQLGFVREVTDEALDFVLLPSVLRHRRGSCVGLGSLLLALAEELSLPAAGVMMPGHFYVRLEQPASHRNVELLRRGEAMPDAWYGERFPIPGGDAPEYARPLSLAEVAGVVEYNVGNARRRQRRLTDARAAFSRAIASFPQFGEAHASLGAMQQLLGQLDQAAASYRLAQAQNPHLPGLERNLALLAAEQRRAR